MVTEVTGAVNAYRAAIERLQQTAGNSDAGRRHSRIDGRQISGKCVFERRMVAAEKSGVMQKTVVADKRETDIRPANIDCDKSHYALSGRSGRYRR